MTKSVSTSVEEGLTQLSNALVLIVAMITIAGELILVVVKANSFDYAKGVNS